MRKTRSRFLTLVVTIVAVLFCAGCEDEQPDQPQSTSNSQPSSMSANDVSTATSPISSGTSAVPVVNHYTITWNVDGTLTTESYIEGEVPEYKNGTPSKASDQQYSYTFNKWNPEISPVTANATYTALFVKHLEQTKINFDLDGGTSEHDSSPIYRSNISSSDFFFDCKKEGWNFRGWSYNGVKVFDEHGNMESEPSLEDSMTFIALYSKTAKMTITCNMDGAGTIVGEGEYTYNTYVDISAHPFEGYLFIGWYFEETLLSNTENYKYMMWSEDVTLEARFKLNSFLMTVQSNNVDYGLVLMRSKNNNDYATICQEYRDFTSEVTIAAYSKTDVRFLGWYDSNNHLVETNAVLTFSMPNHDYSLEAKWNHFEINYVLNGGINSSLNPLYYTVESGSIILSEPTRTGYDFVGWTYNEKEITVIDKTSLDNITIVANWEAHNYSITYELNGGTNNISNPTTYTIESNMITLKDPTKNGYGFEGWYKNSSFTDEINFIESGSSGNLVLYAKWSLISYSITYNLDGGTNSSDNPKIYNVESSFVLISPTKVGYTFLGWFDKEGNEIKSVELGTTGTLDFYAHWNEGNEYTITLKPRGGSVKETLINVRYDQPYSLPTPTRLGYNFLGWYDWSNNYTKVDNDGIWKYTKNKVFNASWDIVRYNISYELNGGTNNSSNPSSYTVEDDVIFCEPTREGYSFAGWYRRGSLINGIPAGSTGSITVIAKWSPILYSLSVTSDDINKGNVSVTEGSGHTDEKITVVATPAQNCVFRGWYEGSTKVCVEPSYTFTMPSKDYSLVAHFLTNDEYEEECAVKFATRPFISEDGKTITYGLYPQEVLNSNGSLHYTLNRLKESGELEKKGQYYLYDGDCYEEITVHPNAKDYSYDYGGSIIEYESRWFKCKPIVWNVLNDNDGVYYAVSSVLLDCVKYCNSTSTRKIGGQTIYANNYCYSDIREWLNNSFYDTAFALDNSSIVSTILDNSAETTNSNSNIYACENTTDKVFLPSYTDMVNSNYGFSTTTDETETRYCKTTDFARARHSFMYKSNQMGLYYTRSPSSVDSTKLWVVDPFGSLCTSYLTRNDISVRPAVYIKIT